MVSQVETNPFDRPTIIPEAEKWHEALRERKAEQVAHDRRLADEQATREAEAQRWRMSVKLAEEQRDAAERQCQEAQLHAQKEVHDAQWFAVQRITEMEDQIRRLEMLLEEEREAHREQFQSQVELAERARQEQETFMIEVSKRHAVDLAAANGRARDAEERADMIQQRANQEIADARAHEEARVARIRAEADARVHDFQLKMREHVEMMDSHAVERQRALEEAMYHHGLRKEEAIAAARRHLAAMEQEHQMIQCQQAAEIQLKEARLQEWKEIERRRNDEVVKHHKDLLDLERSLHTKTMERTIDRVTRHLKFGCEDSEVPADLNESLTEPQACLA